MHNEALLLKNDLYGKQYAWSLSNQSAYQIKNYKEYIELISPNIFNKTPSVIHSAMLSHYPSSTVFLYPS